MRGALGLVAIAACSQPPLTVTFDITQGAEAACYGSSSSPATSCSEIEVPCRSVVSIRIFSPTDEGSPYENLCKELPGHTLCGISTLELPDPPQAIPDQTLEVAIAVFPYSAATVGSDGSLQCPTGVQFDNAGFPIGADEPCLQGTATVCPPDPAIGGRAFYHPGDASTTVSLGCVDITQVDNPTCNGSASFPVMGQVNDFDTYGTVGSDTAPHLTVSVGQPQETTGSNGTEYMLDSADADKLALTYNASVPIWSGEVGSGYTTPCLEVLEDGAEMTATLTCQTPQQPPRSAYDLHGWRLQQSSLATILTALGETKVPDSGLVVGLVLDPRNIPDPNQTVTTSAGTVMYLSGTTLVPGATSSSGIFVSTDAPCGTTFRVTSGAQTAAAYGGLVDGLVTIVVLQYSPPIQD